MILDLGVSATAHAVASGRLSAEDVVAAYTAQREATSDIGAWVDVFAEPLTVPTGPVTAQTPDAEEPRGAHDLPLRGVTVALKDNMAVAGRTYAAGTSVRVSDVATSDADAVSALRTAGATILGMTNMHELALGPWADNPHFGRTHNPWNRECSPGGSSGGSAAAVAARQALAALGTDTGGSVRLPAAMCGVVGLRPTYGAVSTRGVLPAAWSADTVGPFTRTVADNREIFSAIASPSRSTAVRSDAPWRVAVLSGPAFERLEPAVREHFSRAIEQLRRRGHAVREFRPRFMEHAVAAWRTTSAVEAATAFGGLGASERADLGDDVRAQLEAGAQIAATSYVDAQRMRTLIRGEYEELLGQVDLVLTPTVAFTAPKVGADSYTDDRGRTHSLAMEITRFVAPASCAGLPSLSVPVGLDDDGLPTAVLLTGAANSEQLLYQCAEEIEEMQCGRLRRGPVACVPGQ
ncbi:amidase [Microbacterium soli]|uniref:Amidase n=1 Tax=Microbacterium soli TaxID=446075 RepID=A0ABP7NC55_9MICO